MNQPQKKLGTKSSLRSCQPDSRQKSISEIFGKSTKRKLDEIIPVEIDVEEVKSGGLMAHNSLALKSDNHSYSSKDLQLPPDTSKGSKLLVPSSRNLSRGRRTHAKVIADSPRKIETRSSRRTNKNPNKRAKRAQKGDKEPDTASKRSHQQQIVSFLNFNKPQTKGTS